MSEYDWANFDEPEVEERKFAVIPEGNYRAFVEEASWHENSKGTGKYLKLQFSVLDDTAGDEEFKGKKLWFYLNLVHQRENVVKIAEQQLAELKRSMGYDKKQKLKGEDDLCNRELGVRVKHEDYQGAPSPKIHWFFQLEGAPNPVADTSSSLPDDCPF